MQEEQSDGSIPGRGEQLSSCCKPFPGLRGGISHPGGSCKVGAVTETLHRLVLLVLFGIELFAQIQELERETDRGSAGQSN